MVRHLEFWGLNSYLCYGNLLPICAPSRRKEEFRDLGCFPATCFTYDNSHGMRFYCVKKLIFELSNWQESRRFVEIRYERSGEFGFLFHGQDFGRESSAGKIEWKV